MHQPLAEEWLLIRRYNKPINNDVVDEISAGRRREPEIVDLDRRRTIGEHRRPRASREAVEVDEDMDFLGADELRRIQVCGLGDIDKTVECGGEAGADLTAAIGRAE